MIFPRSSAGTGRYLCLEDWIGVRSVFLNFSSKFCDFFFHFSLHLMMGTDLIELLLNGINSTGVYRPNLLTAFLKFVSREISLTDWWPVVSRKKLQSVTLTARLWIFFPAAIVRKGGAEWTLCVNFRSVREGRSCLEKVLHFQHFLKIFR